MPFLILQRFGPSTGKRTSSGAGKSAAAAAAADDGSASDATAAAATAPSSPRPLPGGRASGRKPVKKKVRIWLKDHGPWQWI